MEIDSGVDRRRADTAVTQELRHLEEAATSAQGLGCHSVAEAVSINDGQASPTHARLTTIDTPAFDSGPTGARSLVKT